VNGSRRFEVIAQLKTDAELVLYHHRGLLTYAACQYIAS